MRAAVAELARLRQGLSEETGLAGKSLSVTSKAANARRAGREGLYRKQQSRMLLLNSNMSYLILLQADAKRALQRYE